MPPFLINLFALFGGGMLVALVILIVMLVSNAASNESKVFVENYRKKLVSTGPSPFVAGSSEEKEALERFTGFLQQIGDADFLKKNTALAYTEDAYLNDTIVTHHGPAEIEAYFLKTSETMKSYEVTIDDSFRSGDNYYVRWTMVFAAPALSKGEPIHSVGMSQVRFAEDGRVSFHQDFWDSGANIFGQAPVAGSVINFIRKRIQ